VTWPPDSAFLHGLDFFSGVVSAAGAADWDRPSPCSQWSARDIVGHVGQATRFGTQLLVAPDAARWQPADPPGGAVEGDPAAWWQALTGPARRAVEGADLSRVVDSPAGPRPVGQGLSFPALDLFVHAWDLGRSIGRDVVIPAAAIEFAHAVADPLPEQQVRSGRVFGPARETGPQATATETFIAWTGRDPHWV
jgi:uncharacterized protein (TIGR03086 family)